MRAKQLSSHSGKRALSCPAGEGLWDTRGTTSHIKYEESEVWEHAWGKHFCFCYSWSIIKVYTILGISIYHIPKSPPFTQHPILSPDQRRDRDRVAGKAPERQVVNQSRSWLSESQWLILNKKGTQWHPYFRNKTVIKSYIPNDTKLIFFFWMI